LVDKCVITNQEHVIVTVWLANRGLKMESRMEIKKTAIYLRVSTDLQDTEHQRVAAENYCAMKRYENIEVFEDNGVSGAVDHRSGLDRMLNDVTSGLVGRIVTFEWSRITRSFERSIEVMSILRNHGVTVETPESGIIPFSSALDKLLVAIKGFQAESERENIKARIKSGVKNAIKNNKKTGKRNANGAIWGGAKKENTNAKGKGKAQALVEQLKTLLTAGKSIEEASAELGIGVASAYRLKRRF